MDPQNIRELVLNAREPIVLKNFQHNWRCFRGSLYDWCTFYDSCNTLEKAKTLFERMPLRSGASPQWERQRQRMRYSATQLLHTHKEQQDFWTGMNYVRCKNLPVGCTAGLDFGQLGFPQANDDCTFWFSSPGANTPAHYDTYGCNIVVQIYGRKSWLLFPPGTPLSCIRIPYEESSVYCSENFYAPNPQELGSFQHLQDCAYHIVLEPNDVLIVPHQWWHFVESLETSLSVNTWIPLEIDTDIQLEECIVKFLMERFIVQATPAVLNYVLNPNQLQKDVDDAELFMLAEHLIKKRNIMEPAAKSTDNTHMYHYLGKEAVERLIDTLKTAERVSRLSPENFKSMLMRHTERYNSFVDVGVVPPLNPMHEALINSVCAPNVVKVIKEELIKRFKL